MQLIAETETAAPTWRGFFNPHDRAELAALRAGQAAAIARQDAAAYADLCADDLVLLFPGRDLVRGRSEFIAFESALFRAHPVATMRKYPLRLERSGALAVEVGCHEILAAPAPGLPEEVVARRKYVHILRKTAAGWRFAFLASTGSDPTPAITLRDAISSSLNPTAFPTMNTTSSSAAADARGIQWVGAFAPEDRAQIAALRQGQLRAIETGDPAAYGQLVVDDIHILLSGRDLVTGREDFMAFQTAVFRGAKFTGMKKIPLRVERSGDLAVEIGRQEFAAPTGTFAARQKYLHVMRRTPAGWRFAVLTSNNSE